MNRIFAAVLLTALAGAAVVFESSPQGTAVRAASAGWLAANALPKEPEKIVAIELPRGGTGMKALGAALTLRATLRYQPKGIGFFIPIEAGDDTSLLVSKLEDAKIPVVFTFSEQLEPMSQVTITAAVPEASRAVQKIFAPEGYPKGALAPAPLGQVAICARQGARAVASNAWRFGMALEKIAEADVTGSAPGWIRAGSTLAPVDAQGCADSNPLARTYVEHVSFAQLMLQTERSEQGAISATLDSQFRGRLVVVQIEGDKSAERVAALRNRLADLPARPPLSFAAVLVAATLPWWSARRRRRSLLAFMGGCMLALLALAVYSEFRLTLPLLVIVILPLLALIPGGRKPPSDEVRSCELPAR